MSSLKYREVKSSTAQGEAGLGLQLGPAWLQRSGFYLRPGYIANVAGPPLMSALVRAPAHL